MSRTESASRLSAWQKQDVLDRLRAAASAIGEATRTRETLIQEALVGGLSERVIGDAAGLSGVTIHNRKTQTNG